MMKWNRLLPNDWTTCPAFALVVILFLAGCVAPGTGNTPSNRAESVNPLPSGGTGDPATEGEGSGPAPSARQAAVPVEAPIPTIAGSTPFLLPEGEEKRPLATYTISMIDAPVREVLFALARDAELNVDIYPGIDAKITLNAVNQTLPAILDRIVEQTNLQYQIKDSVITITPDKPFRRSYHLDYLQTKRAATSGMTVSTQMAASEGGASGSNGSQVTLNSTDSATDFWENLVLNITNLLDTQDEKEGGSAGTATATAGSGGTTGAAAAPASAGGSAAGNTKVVLNRATGVVNVLATNRQHKQVQAFIDRVMRIAMRQVFIEATVISVELSESHQSGVDWGLLAANGTADANNGQYMLNRRVASAPNMSFKLNRAKIPFMTGVMGVKDLTATIRLLSQFGNAKVVSTPKVTVINNQTAVLRVTTNQVYFEIKVTPATIQTAAGGAQAVIPPTTQTVVRTAPVGFIMQVTPQIDDNNMITMNIRPTLQRISEWVDNPDPNMRTNQTAGVLFTPPQVPVVQVQEMDSILRVSNGQVAVMGGLMQDETNKNMDGVPYLSKLPVLGPLFSYRNDGNTKKELVIFLRPSILTEGDDLQKFGDPTPYHARNRHFDNYWGQTGAALP
ncbi:MAG: secretin and TonB N-terminal domain-containing protein [Magnetococcales bacterium]|nr:secretin and TonB N-terminal domain-containing protein [Magnetococcales bacterium]